MVGVEQWAEIRRMHRVERSIRLIHRRAGLHRETIGRVLASDRPQVYRRRGLEARPRKGWIEDQPRANPRVPSMRRASWSRSWAMGAARRASTTSCAGCALVSWPGAPFRARSSRNRRNVAVSRAQSVAVVVCSPRLMWTSATPSSRCGWSSMPCGFADAARAGRLGFAQCAGLPCGASSNVRTASPSRPFCLPA